MKVNTKNIVRKVNRELELDAGRISYNRIHKDKKKYDRQRDKKFFEKSF
jgi:hypothetical protein